MQQKDDEYHVRRAREELDLGYRAENREAAASHLRLAALHMALARNEAYPSEQALTASAVSIHVPIGMGTRSAPSGR